MRNILFDLAALTLVVSGNCIAADTADAIAIDPIQTVTAEPGVLPPGTTLMVRTKETVNTAKAYRSTVYLASTAADILDQHGAMLIPRDSPIEPVVRSLSYLGPGGADMTLLTLNIDAVVVRDIRYTVEPKTRSQAQAVLAIAVARPTGSAVRRRPHTRSSREVRELTCPRAFSLVFQIPEPLRLEAIRGSSSWRPLQGDRSHESA